MSIEYAILGFLSWESFTGYELKKFFEESETLYWSGSNNQIYRTLVKLHKEGLVTREVHEQENYPARKVYTISQKGRAALQEWLRATPELPQLRQPLLLQLMWAHELPAEELQDLLDRYEEELRVKLLMVEEESRRQQEEPARTTRERYLWQMIDQNWLTFYEGQLEWLRRLRRGLVARQKEV